MDAGDLSSAFILRQPSPNSGRVVASHFFSSACLNSISRVHCDCLQLSFGWNTVKIDMSAARRDPLPIVPFGLAAFAATLFALGLALGTTIAVGMLFFIQVKFLVTSV